MRLWRSHRFAAAVLALNATTASLGAGPCRAGSSSEEDYLAAGKAAPIRFLDPNAPDSTFWDWMRARVGPGTPTHWEVNDCGEGAGSAMDYAIPVCVQASAAISGGRELYVLVAVGTASLGVGGPPELAYAGIDGPDTSLFFQDLAALRQHLDADRGRNLRVYVDERRDVHLVTSNQGDLRLTKGGGYRDARISPDGGTIGMLRTTTVSRPGSQTYEPVEVATQLCLYRGGRVTRQLEPGGFIRAWSFMENGAKVGLYSGGLHFAGFYVLYDAATGEDLAHAKDPIQAGSPAWAAALAP